MESISATFRIVTPMFIAGADQKGAELRVASMKGVLRFWWRALEWPQLVSFEPRKQLGELKRREAELFGGAGKAQGQSKIRLRLVDAQVASPEAERAAKWPPASWENYTGYGLKDGARACLPGGGIFRLELSARRRDDLERALPALEVLGLCGGLGARSRNGWGSLTLTKIEGVSGWEVASTANEIKARLKAFIQSSLVTAQPPYTGASSLAQIGVGKSHKNPNEAHRALGTQYRDFVHPTRGAGSRPLAVLPGVSPKEARKQFGLPRQGLSTDRRAKPLFIHVHQAAEDAPAFPVAVYLPGDWGQGEEAIPYAGRHLIDFVRTVDTL
ncbi:MAG: type III-B CRISPR module RAMP protein Cmr1 [Vulcanimicrobiaceae bacterium]